jgi:hypothetical protein
MPSLARLNLSIYPLPGHPWPGVRSRFVRDLTLSDSGGFAPSAPPLKAVFRAMLLDLGAILTAAPDRPEAEFAPYASNRL